MTAIANSTEFRPAIVQLALSLDAFILNGIQYGVLHCVNTGFLQRTANTLRGDLSNLARLAPDSTNSTPIRELRPQCERLISAVESLNGFHALELEQVRSAVAEIRLLHGECTRSIRALEETSGTSPSFYESRPATSAVAIADFLANLGTLLDSARNTANTRNAGSPPATPNN